MMQKSVYSKLVLNKTVSDAVKKAVGKNKPEDGLLQLLEITEKQFSEIEYLLGTGQDTVIDSDARVVEI